MQDKASKEWADQEGLYLMNRLGCCKHHVAITRPTIVLVLVHIRTVFVPHVSCVLQLSHDIRADIGMCSGYALCFAACRQKIASLRQDWTFTPDQQIWQNCHCTDAAGCLHA